MTHDRLEEQVAFAIADIINDIVEPDTPAHELTEEQVAGISKAAIAVVLEAAAQYADRNAAEAWGDKYARGLMRLQAEDIAAAIRALGEK